MKNIFSIIVIVASVVVVLTVTKPQYDEILAMKEQETELEEVLSNAKTLQRLRDGLLEKRKQLKTDDLARLEKIIPENSDNVKLILELQKIANDYDLELQTASSEKDESDEEGARKSNFDIQTKDYGIITLEFTVRGSYANFISFLSSLEKNIRITDVRALTIGTNVSDDNQSYEYQLVVETYWLKDNI